RKLRDEVLDRYGGCCACCGESCKDFLTIDHINGGGSRERRTFKKGYSWYLYLRKAELRADLRVFCANCNIAFLWLGYCPHKPPRSLPDHTGRPIYLHDDRRKIEELV